MSTKQNSEKSKPFEQTLWVSADKLRGTVESSVYKHVMFSLIFLKLLSGDLEISKAKTLAKRRWDDYGIC